MKAAVTVKVVLSPVFRDIFHHRELDVVLPEREASVSGLLLKLSEQSAGQTDKLVFEEKPDLILPALMVQVNDRTYTGNVLNRQPVPLGDGDTVTLLYYISGG